MLVLTYQVERKVFDVVDVRGLKAEIVRNGMTQKELCKEIDMPLSTFVRKLRFGVFTTDEALAMVDVLNIENPEKIFFARKLTYEVKKGE